MTMMMTDSPFGQEDMEALLWGPSSPMADAMDSLLFHPEQEEQRGGGLSSEGVASPATSFTSSLPSSSSPPPFYSPPPSPLPLLHGDKAATELDLFPPPPLGHPGQQGHYQRISDHSKEDAFGHMEWMTERVDLSLFDLDSLIGSCSPAEESPSSADDFLASLNCPIELDDLPMPSLSASSVDPTAVNPAGLSPACPDNSLVPVVATVFQVEGQQVPSPSLCVPEAQEELEIKSEPVSPSPLCPPIDSPCSPAYTLDLGSEVDVSECEVKPAVPEVAPQVQRVVLSLSSPRIVLVLTPKDEVGTNTATPEVIQSSPASSATPSSRPQRSRPYPEPKGRASPPSPVASSSGVGSFRRQAGGEERGGFKAPKDKKLKKMVQNKTAATRYRQKKRAEQEALTGEHAMLERKNVELTEKAESMAREIEYLKELMEEVRQTRIKKGLSADP